MILKDILISGIVTTSRGWLTWLDIGYHLDSGFVEMLNHPLEVRVPFLIHGEHPSVASLGIDSVA